MRDRLIELLENCGRSQMPMVAGLELWADDIADYLLENGVIVMPCTYGDKIYCDGKYFASHCAGEIMEFTVNDIETKVSSMFRGEPDVQFDFDAFGKTVFLSREQAEKALAEVANEKH